MLARLLYSAVALCALGTYPGRAATRAAPAADLAAVGVAAQAEIAPARAAPSGIGGTPADFAIPPKHR